jgi:hypothetical protein
MCRVIDPRQKDVLYILKYQGCYRPYVVVTKFSIDFVQRSGKRLRGIFRNITDNQRCSWVMQKPSKAPLLYLLSVGLAY